LKKSDKKQSTPFLDDLLRQLEQFTLFPIILSLHELLQYDWSPVKAKLVYSFPGNKVVGPDTTGLVMLAKQVSGIVDSAGSIEYLGSSIGKAEIGWLKDLASCALGKLPKEQDTATTTFKIVFPNMNYVMNSPTGPNVQL